MDKARILQKIKTTPPPKLAALAVRKSLQWLHTKLRKAKDRLTDTHLPAKDSWGEENLFISAKALDTSGLDDAVVRLFTQMWCEHRFDLLGSGWVECGYLDNAPGFCGNRYPCLVLAADRDGAWLGQILARQNVANARKIWRLVTPGYRPIDWQKDYKSGYRFNTKVHYSGQRWADKPGGDIKVPWELSRLQHLPRMAVFALVCPDDAVKSALEFQNQCLDFIAQNPPRMGVNWACTMDVAIRAANMAAAYSLFVTSGHDFPKAFRQVFLTSLTEHCHHIKNNLEWSETLTSNHYLTNVAGLLFASTLLPRGKRQRQWAAFAAGEVLNEIEKQFHREGSNFEGSTAYHRLSTDMAVYACALMLGEETAFDFCEAVTDRLYGAGRFLEAVRRPDGDFSQVGDNDSGFFIRLSPTGGILTAVEAKRLYRSLDGYQPLEADEPYPDERLNDPGPTIAAVCGLFGVCTQTNVLESSFVRALSKGRCLRPNWAAPKVMPGTPALADLPYTGQDAVTVSGINLLQGLECLSFPQFGLYVFRSNALYLLVNGSDNGQNGNAGHAHNDKLSYELIIDGHVYAQDPGTLAYTASSELRDQYRSRLAHHTIDTGVEQNEFVSAFMMKNQSRCTLLELTASTIVLEATYRGVVHRRRWAITSQSVVIEDFCNKPFVLTGCDVGITAGYGKLLR